MEKDIKLALQYKNPNEIFPDSLFTFLYWSISYFWYSIEEKKSQLKIIEEKGGSIFSIKDINEKCSMCGIPCFYVFFSFSIPILNFCELEKEFKRIPYYVVSKPLHAY